MDLMIIIIDECRHLRPYLTVDTTVERSRSPLNLNESHDILTTRRHDETIDAGLVQIGFLVFGDDECSAV